MFECQQFHYAVPDYYSEFMRIKFLEMGRAFGYATSIYNDYFYLIKASLIYHSKNFKSSFNQISPQNLK